ncbi:hypothetical protein N7G274_002982 [Stereocaulon virgatum]|uniref:HIT-type domain-containing protein n=1 Tax=Stereocaulon virgatum TaxID=373712 RepID=A0ABR4AEM6_9LECA
MSGQLLTSLCTICHVRPYRYRCPRCSVLTCSLPCIKRHKQWAQCNGLRDPTVYVKAKDLATPKGIDHDYNYLTSIERELDNAEKDATSRGVVLQEPSIKQSNPKKNVTRLEAALERCGVVVVKAPKGMTRSKQNDTRVTQRTHGLIWTVEWVHPDGRKVLGRCPEDQSIAKAYMAHVFPLDPHKPIKKRKKGHETFKNAQTDTAIPHDAIRERASPNGHGLAHEQGIQVGKELAIDGTQIESSKCKHKNDGDEERVGHDGSEPSERILPHNQNQVPTRQDGPDVESTHGKHNSSLAPADDGQDTQLNIPAKSEQPTVTADATQPVLESSLTFHLHHPSLPSRQPVLIPLSPDSDLATSLTNRLVLEFPTIYVLHRQPDDKLPPGFISEEDFFTTVKKVMVADAGLGNGVNGKRIEAEAKTEEPFEEGEVNEGRLFEVLGKDLEGLPPSL